MSTHRGSGRAHAWPMSEGSGREWWCGQGISLDAGHSGDGDHVHRDGGGVCQSACGRRVYAGAAGITGGHTAVVASGVVTDVVSAVQTDVVTVTVTVTDI